MTPKPIVDRVRVVLPIEVYGNPTTGRAAADALSRLLAAVSHAGAYDVVYRVDQGLAITAEFRRPIGGSPAGAVASAAAVATTLERALERWGNKLQSVAQRAELERAMRHVVIKVNR